MTLPTLNTNKYTLELPSTKKKIEYRPFLVKEEKLLLIAQESDDQLEIVQVIKDIIDACTFGKLKVDELQTYDIEYIFIKLRIKSVDQNADIMTECPHCRAATPVSIDLEAVEVKFPEEEVSQTIMLSDDGVGITLKNLSLSETANISDDSDFNDVIAAIIDTIFDKDNVYAKTDSTKEELNTFIDSFSRKNVEAIEHYISSQPTIKYESKGTCSSCSKEFDIKLSGLKDFFV
jgi:hypothetical protein